MPSLPSWFPLSGLDGDEYSDWRRVAADYPHAYRELCEMVWERHEIRPYFSTHPYGPEEFVVFAGWGSSPRAQTFASEVVEAPALWAPFTTTADGEDIVNRPPFFRVHSAGDAQYVSAVNAVQNLVPFAIYQFLDMSEYDGSWDSWFARTNEGGGHPNHLPVASRAGMLVDLRDNHGLAVGHVDDGTLEYDAYGRVSGGDAWFTVRPACPAKVLLATVGAAAAGGGFGWAPCRPVSPLVVWDSMTAFGDERPAVIIRDSTGDQTTYSVTVTGQEIVGDAKVDATEHATAQAGGPPVELAKMWNSVTSVEVTPPPSTAHASVAVEYQSSPAVYSTYVASASRLYKAVLDEVAAVAMWCRALAGQVPAWGAGKSRSGYGRSSVSQADAYAVALADFNEGDEADESGQAPRQQVTAAEGTEYDGGTDTYVPYWEVWLSACKSKATMAVETGASETRAWRGEVYAAGAASGGATYDTFGSVSLLEGQYRKVLEIPANSELSAETGYYGTTDAPPNASAPGETTGWVATAPLASAHFDVDGGLTHYL